MTESGTKAKITKQDWPYETIIPPVLSIIHYSLPLNTSDKRSWMLLLPPAIPFSQRHVQEHGGRADSLAHILSLEQIHLIRGAKDTLPRHKRDCEYKKSITFRLLGER